MHHQNKKKKRVMTKSNKIDNVMEIFDGNHYVVF